MPRNPVRRRKEADTEIHAGGDDASRPDGQCHREYTAGVSQETQVRVKRWSKRPPLEAQATRHGKPHRVQGQIGDPGAARSRFRESETGSGYRSLRQMILSPENFRGRQNSAYSPSKIIPYSLERRFVRYDSVSRIITPRWETSAQNLRITRVRRTTAIGSPSPSEGEGRGEGEVDRRSVASSLGTRLRCIARRAEWL